MENNKDCPKELVKFTKLEYLGDILNNKLKASFPHEFNDPFDSQLHISRDDLQEIAKHANVDVKEVSFHENFILTTQSTSLIEIDPISYKANLMWSHYADCGSGIAVVYDFDEVNRLHNKKAQANFLRRIRYIDHGPQTRDMFESYIKSHSIENFKNKIKGEIDQEGIDLINALLTYKYQIWNYENEYRIISQVFLKKLIDLHPNSDPYSLTNLMQLRYLKFETYLDLNKIISSIALKINIPPIESLFIDMPKPKKIIIGYKVEDYQIQKLLNLHQSFIKNKDIQVVRLKIPSGIYSENNSFEIDNLLDS